MIVVDTNLIASLFLPTEATAMAERVLKQDSQWAAPCFWRSEFRNVLATGMRTGRFDFSFAVEAMQAAEELVAGNEYSLPNLPILRLARESGCSAYDCEFVALAEELGIHLVTFDKQVLKAFPERALAPSAYLSAT